MNDRTWASLIEQSVGPVKSYSALPRKQSSQLFSVALVSKSVDFYIKFAVVFYFVCVLLVKDKSFLLKIWPPP